MCRNRFMLLLIVLTFTLACPALADPHDRRLSLNPHAPTLANQGHMEVQELPEDQQRQQPPPEQPRPQQPRPQQPPDQPDEREPAAPRPAAPEPADSSQRRTETGGIIGFHEDREGGYMDLSIGTSSNRHDRVDAGWAMHLAFGGYINMYRLELDLGYRSHDIDYGNFTDDFSVFSLLFNVMVDIEIPIVPGLELSAGGGIGGASAHESFGDTTVSGLAYQFKAGVGYRLHDNFQVGAGYRLINIDTGTGEAMFSSRENFHGGDLSIRFNF